ncbi:MAG: spore photoproduct lyase [Methanosarcina sp.]
MKLFSPDRVIFEPKSLEYPLGKKIYDYFEGTSTEVLKAPLQKVSSIIPGTTEGQRYASGKRTLVVAVKKSLKFDICKPSADFEFSLVTGCPASCEYCYLYTTQSSKPYLRTYVNLEEIFNSIKSHVAQNKEEVTTFEVASAGDPLAIEHITGSLARTIEFFGTLDNARLRVVTKFSNVEPLLNLNHNGRTRFRVSINSRYVIKNFEHNTASFEERIEAASKLAAAGYPIGFIVAPIMIYEGWKEEYSELFEKLQSKINMHELVEPVTFELIQHRFTPVAKKFILERFPNTSLDMDESKRTLKWGKFGRYKYVYPKEDAAEMKKYFTSLIEEKLPQARIEYFT